MHIRPSVRLTALPEALPFEERFALARAAGFEGVELEAGAGPAAEIRAAADSAGIIVHSVHCTANYRLPLSSGDPAERDAGIAATLAAIEAAAIMGADTVLLIPGMVNAETSYSDAYRRSREVIGRDILPAAERHKITLAIENVWSGFLLSPMEFARFIDSFGSPFVRLYLDVGNIIFGHPEGWIDIAGERIVKLHLKDFRFEGDLGYFGSRRVGEGDIHWRKVRDALQRIDFAGWAVLAEIEKLQPRAARQAFKAARLFSSQLGPNPLCGFVETQISRRLIADAMRRFQRYVEPGGARASAA